MIKRIVKLTFREEEVDHFLSIFEESKDRIRNFPGCQYLELLRNEAPENVFFTYSFWDSPEDLEAYRSSSLFKSTWSRTKKLFSDKPQAWSVTPVERFL